MNIFWGHILEVDIVNLCAVLDILSHPGGCDNIVHQERRVPFQLNAIAGGIRALSLGVHLLDLLDDFKETGSAGDAVGLEGWGDGQTDGLFGTAQIGNYQVGSQGVQTPLNHLDTGKERF